MSKRTAEEERKRRSQAMAQHKPSAHKKQEPKQTQTVSKPKQTSRPVQTQSPVRQQTRQPNYGSRGGRSSAPRSEQQSHKQFSGSRSIVHTQTRSEPQANTRTDHGRVVQTFGQRPTAGQQRAQQQSHKRYTDRREQSEVARNIGRAAKKGLQDAASGWKQTIRELPEMAGVSSTDKSSLKVQAMRMGKDPNDKKTLAHLESIRKNEAEENRKARQKSFEERQERQRAFDEQTKDASGFEKALYGATESGVGMFTDLAVGAAAGAVTGGSGSLAALGAMGARTYGQTRGQAEAEGATEEEDRRNALLQAAKEMGTERIFAGVGLAKGFAGKGTLSLADRAAAKLTNKLTGKAGDIVSAGARLAGGVAEENAEELAGWAADPLISEAAYQRNVRQRRQKQVKNQLKEESDALRAQITDENTARSIATYLGSNDFLEQNKKEYIGAGLSEKRATAMAEKMRDYLTASLTGDTDEMERLEKEMSTAIAGKGLSKSSWDFGELAETVGATTVLTASTGMAGTVRSAAQGAQIKESLGDKGIKALTRTAVDFEDEELSEKAQIISERVEAGKGITDTQAFELKQGMERQIQKDARRIDASRNTAQREIEVKEFITPYTENEDGSLNLGEVTSRALSMDTKAAQTAIRAINNENKGDTRYHLDAKQVKFGAKAIAAFQSGVMNIDDVNAFTYYNKVVRQAFEETTGIDLDKYVVRGKNGEVDIPATNTKTKDALFVIASQNLVKAAEAETENWMNYRKGEVVSGISARMGGKGTAVLQQVLGDVDERNRSEYELNAIAGDYMYQRGRNMGTEWESVSEQAKAMFPEISASKLENMYRAGLEDRALAEDTMRNRAVVIGESMSEMGEQETATGDLIIETNEDLSGSVIQTFTEIAQNLGADIHLVDYIKNVDGDAIEGANGAYDPKTNTFYLNVATGIEKNVGYIFMHEATHYLKTHAPEQYQRLENLVREKWFSMDPEQMQTAIARKIEAYRKATKGRQVLTEEEALEEIIADAAHEFITDPHFAEQVAEDDPTLAKAIINSIREVLRKLRRIFASGSITDETHMNSLFSELDILTEAEALWLDAYKTAVRNKASADIDAWQDRANQSLSVSGEGGYNGRSMSNRAVRAYEQGEMPLSKWGKTDIIEAVNFANEGLDLSKMTKQELQDTFLTKTSWHHTGAMYSRTDFYSIDEDRAENITQDEIDQITGNRTRTAKSAEQKEAESRNQSAVERTKDVLGKLNVIYRAGTTGLKSLSGVISRWEKGSLDLDAAYDEAMDRIRSTEGSRVDQWRSLPEDHWRQKSVDQFDNDFEGYVRELYPEPSTSSKEFKRIKKTVSAEDQTRLSVSEIESALKEKFDEYKKDETNLRIATEAIKDLQSARLSVSESSKGDVSKRWGRDIQVRTIAKGITSALVNEGYIDFRGQTVNGPEDLAKLCQVLRDPRFETSRMVFTKGNKIVDFKSVSARMPGMTFIHNKASDAEHFEEMRAHMQNIGADGYYLIHNHPSGNVTASRADLLATARTINELGGDYYKGHIILDHDKYGLIENVPAVYEKTGETLPSASEVDMYGQQTIDLIHTPEVSHPVLDETVRNSDDIAKIGSFVNASNDVSCIVYLAADGQVRGVQEIANEMLERYADPNSNDDIRDFIREQSVEFGAMRAAVYSTTTDNDIDITSSLLNLYKEGVLLDVVRPAEDISFADQGIPQDADPDLLGRSNTEVFERTIVYEAMSDYSITEEQREELNNDGKGAPQVEVQPNFDMDVAAEVMAQYEGDADTLPVAQDVVDKFVDELADNKRYSFTDVEQRDRDYMDAVDSGDMDEAQRLVNEAAKSAGYKTKAYHGTGNNFTVFDPERSGRNYNGYSKYGRGLYFSDSEESAKEWGNNRNVIGAYLNLRKPFDASGLISDDALMDEYNKLANTKYSEYPASFVFEDLNSLSGDNSYSTNLLKSLGYDGIIVKHEAIADTPAWTEYVVFDPEQIKSADPVTYAEDGSVIPLSERFDPENNDIRYSLPTEDSDGNILTDGQMEYFKNSQARDRDGKLAVVYHTTEHGGFTVFDPQMSDDHRSLFFTDSLPASMTYAEDYYQDIEPIDFDTEDDEQIGYYTAYLNIENPLIADATGYYWDFIPFRDGYYKTRELSEIAAAEGYDGVIVRNVIDLDSKSRFDFERAGLGTVKSVRNISLNIVKQPKLESMWDDEEESPDRYTAYLNVEIEGDELSEELYSDDDASDPIEDIYAQAKDVWTNYFDLDENIFDTVFYNHYEDGAVEDRDIYYVDADGMQIDNDTVNKAMQSTVYIVFSGNQIKDTRNENPTEDPDIRYSMTPEDEAMEWLSTQFDLDDVPLDDPAAEEGRIRMAKTKKEYLQSIKRTWNDRWLTEGKVLKESSVKKEIRELVMGVMANSDTDRQYKKSLVDKLLVASKSAYWLIKDGKNAEAGELLWNAATQMIEDVDFIDDTMFQQYKDLRNYLRTTPFRLGEEYWSDVHYNEFRKRNFGRLKLVKGETNIDNLYLEMQDLWPEWFNEERESTPPDQLLHIEEVLDQIQPYKIAYSSEEAADLAMDVAMDLYGIIYNGEEHHSIADTYKNRYDERTKALKARHQEALRKVKEDQQKKVDKQKAKFKEYKEKQKNAREKAKHFGRIADNIDWLTDRLVKETKDKNIPEPFRRSLAHLLMQFDMQTERSKALEEKYGPAKKTLQMRELKRRLEDIAKEDDTGEFRYDGYLFYLMDALAEKVDGKVIDSLDTEDLIVIDTMLKSIKHNFRNYQNVKIAEKNVEISTVGDKTIEAMEQHIFKYGKRKSYTGARGFIDKLLNEGEETPIYLFERIDPKGEGIGAMYKELRRGEDKHIKNMDFLRKRFQAMFGDYFNRKKPGSELESWRDRSHEQTFDLEHGSITLNPAQIMSLYCLSKRTQALGHILGAGIVASPVNVGQKLREAVKGREEQVNSVMITAPEIQKIVLTLTPEQVKLADEMQSLMNNEMAAWGNETSLEMHGIKLFREKDYFPIKSSGESLTKTADSFDVQEKIKNFGFTKPLVRNANNAIMIDDIFSVVADHCNKMSLYNSMAIPISDFMRVYNYKQKREDGSIKTVQQAIGEAFTRKVNNYIMKFIGDVNGNTETRSDAVDDLFNKALANYKKASIGANFRVALQQPTAIFRAFMEISPKYFAGVKPISPKDMREMFQHCPIALWKSWGHYDMDMGRDIEDVMMNNDWSKWDTLTMGIYGGLDNMTWSIIWQAVKKEVKANNPKVEVGSPEFFELCNARASEVFDKTQVVDSIFHRSDTMRSKKTLTKMAVSFMAEPTLTYNVFRNTLVNSAELWKDGKHAEAIVKWHKMGAVLALNAAAVSASAAIWDAVRGKGADDDDDKEMSELWFINFIENLKDNVNMFNNIYFVKDIKDIQENIDNGFGGTSNMALEGFSTFFTGISQMKKKLEEGSKKSWYDIFMNIGGGFGYITGIPIKTMMRDARAIVQKLGIPVFADDGSVVGEEKINDWIDTFRSKLPRFGGGDEESDTSTSSDSGSSKSSENKVTQEEAFAKMEKKAAEKASEYSGTELDEKLWDVVSDGYTKKLDAADFEYLNRIRQIYEANGGDVDKFDAKIVDKCPSAYKKTLNADMTDEDIEKQQKLKEYMLDHGVTDEEISDMCYHSYTARDLKAALRMNNEEYIMDELVPLVRAGLTRSDWEKLVKNMNYGAKTYDGKYSSDEYKGSTGTFVWPAQGPITSEFGYRNAPTAGASSNHPAIDIGASQGSPVVAADGGTVISAGNAGGYGNQVAVQHENGMVTYYSHLYSWNVKVGDTVSQGQQIGQVGSTGISTGPHLDFKVEVNGEPVNPLEYLSN